MRCEDLADDLAATADGSVLLGRSERRHAAVARANRLGDTFDGAAFARGIPSLEEHQHACTRLGHPVLHLDEFDLESLELGLVQLLRHPVDGRLDGLLLRHPAGSPCWSRPTLCGDRHQ